MNYLTSGQFSGQPLTKFTFLAVLCSRVLATFSCLGIRWKLSLATQTKTMSIYSYPVFVCSSWVGCCATVLLLQHVHLNPFCFPGLIATGGNALLVKIYVSRSIISACKTYLENHYGSYMLLPAAAQRCRGPCNEGNDLQKVQQKRACH